jgi:hypothetical protein
MTENQQATQADQSKGEGANARADEEEGYDNPGIEGQILYPEVIVDAERAAAYAGGKEEFLYPEGEEPADTYLGPNPLFQDRPTGDESGEETEPTENPDYDPNNPEHHPA